MYVCIGKTVHIGFGTTGGFRHPLWVWNVSLRVRDTVYCTKAGGLVLALYVHIRVTASLVSLRPGTWQVLCRFRDEFAKSPCLSEALCCSRSSLFHYTLFNPLLVGHQMCFHVRTLPTGHQT